MITNPKVDGTALALVKSQEHELDLQRGKAALAVLHQASEAIEGYTPVAIILEEAVSLRLRSLAQRVDRPRMHEQAGDKTAKCACGMAQAERDRGLRHTWRMAARRCK